MFAIDKTNYEIRKQDNKQQTSEVWIQDWGLIRYE